MIYLKSNKTHFYLSIFRIPAPHIVAARAYRMMPGTSGTNNLAGIFASNSQANQLINSPSSSSTATTAAAAASASSSSSSQEKTPLYRLAKLLNQTNNKANNQVLKDDAPRRLSWER